VPGQVIRSRLVPPMVDTNVGGEDRRRHLG
jgi:hypothetical protein